MFRQAVSASYPRCYGTFNTTLHFCILRELRSRLRPLARLLDAEEYEKFVASMKSELLTPPPTTTVNNNMYVNNNNKYVNNNNYVNNNKYVSRTTCMSTTITTMSTTTTNVKNNMYVNNKDNNVIKNKIVSSLSSFPLLPNHMIYVCRREATEAADQAALQVQETRHYQDRW